MNPTLALIHKGGHQVALTVPTGAIISVDKGVFRSEKFVDVTWNEKPVMMFVEDLLLRAERVN